MKDRVVFTFEKRELVLLILTFFIFAIAIFFIGFVAGTKFSKSSKEKKYARAGVKEIKIPAVEESKRVKYVVSTTHGTEIYVVSETAAETRERPLQGEKESESGYVEKKEERRKSPPQETVSLRKKSETKKAEKKKKIKLPRKSVPPVKIRKPFTVQIAAFRRLSDAYNLMRKLQRMGFDAYYERTNIPGKGIWFRVRVGHYRTRDEATKAARRIKRKTGYPAFVTISKKR